jgi:hypothetical protein
MTLAVWEKSLAFVCFLTLILQGVTARHNKNTRKSLPAMVKYFGEICMTIFCVFGTENLNTLIV